VCCQIKIKSAPFFNDLKFKSGLPKNSKLSAALQERIQLRIIPDQESGLSEVRFWQEDEFLGSQKVKKY